jgi:hypothetical protein
MDGPKDIFGDMELKQIYDDPNFNHVVGTESEQATPDSKEPGEVTARLQATPSVGSPTPGVAITL